MALTYHTPRRIRCEEPQAHCLSWAVDPRRGAPRTRVMAAGSTHRSLAPRSRRSYRGDADPFVLAGPGRELQRWYQPRRVAPHRTKERPREHTSLPAGGRATSTMAGRSDSSERSSGDGRRVQARDTSPDASHVEPQTGAVSRARCPQRSVRARLVVNSAPFEFARRPMTRVQLPPPPPSFVSGSGRVTITPRPVPEQPFPPPRPAGRRGSALHRSCGCGSRARPTAPYLGTGAPASPESSFQRRSRPSISPLTRRRF